MSVDDDNVDDPQCIVWCHKAPVCKTDRPMDRITTLKIA